jgi:hypothetical protein
MRNPVVWSIALVALLSGACNTSPLIFDFTRAEPNEADLVGGYVATKETIEELRRRGHFDIDNKEPPRIFLQADHTFSFQKVPDWLSWGAPGSSRLLFSHTGKWELGTNAEGGHWCIYLTSYNGAHTPVALRKQTPPYLIYLIMGDPDAGFAMTFQRVASTTKLSVGSGPEAGLAPRGSPPEPNLSV